MERAVMFFAVVVFVGRRFRQAPKRADQVPGYPGAKLVSEQQSPTREEDRLRQGADMGFRLGARHALLHRVRGAGRPVLRDKTRSRPGAGRRRGPNHLAPGQLSSVGSLGRVLGPRPRRRRFGRRQGGVREGARLPGVYAWASGAAFSWAYKNAEKDPYSFTLTITDKSVTDHNPSRLPSAHGDIVVRQDDEPGKDGGRPGRDAEKRSRFLVRRRRSSTRRTSRHGARRCRSASALPMPDRQAERGGRESAGGALNPADREAARSRDISGGPIRRGFVGRKEPAAQRRREGIHLRGARQTGCSRPVLCETDGNAVGDAAGNAFFIPINFGKPAQKGRHATR